MTSKTELKPCPFCGEKARLQPIGDSYYVTCDGSYCKIKPTTWAYIVKERAIEEWNKRGSVDVSEKVVSVQTVRCKNCKYAHMTISGSCKYCDQFTDDYGQLIEMYFDKDFFCGYAERKAE